MYRDESGWEGGSDSKRLCFMSLVRVPAAEPSGSSPGGSALSPADPAPLNSPVRSCHPRSQNDTGAAQLVTGVRRVLKNTEKRLHGTSGKRVSTFAMRVSAASRSDGAKTWLSGSMDPWLCGHLTVILACPTHSCFNPGAGGCGREAGQCEFRLQLPPSLPPART